MKRQSELAYLIFVIDLLLTQVALMLAEGLRRRLEFGVEIPSQTFYLTPTIHVAVALIWAVAFIAFNVPESRPTVSWFAEFRNLALAIGISLFTLAGFFYWAKIEDFSRLLYFYFLVLDLALVGGFHLALRAFWWYLMRRGYGIKRVLIVGAGGLGRLIGERVRRDERRGLKLVGYLREVDQRGEPEPVLLGDEGPIIGVVPDIVRVVDEYAIDEVVVALPAGHRGRIVEIVAQLQSYPVTIRVVPDLLDIVTIRATVEDYGGVPLIGVREPAIVGFDRALKRALDVVGAAVGLLIFGPTVMLLTAIAVKLDSPGPIFYTQVRTGENGRTFRMIKFRSMYQGADRHVELVKPLSTLPGPAFKVKADPRVTRVGRVIRRTSIDELPQLVNVLLGHMSLVGPRPEEVSIARQYSSWHYKRLMVKPGLTGPMQINGRGDLPLDDRVKLELAYIENYSILTDLKIIAKTVPVVISGKGSY
ncbi:MAG TPA: sugar transferase [Dehalococcoidia bacterium]|nr:sugar transferase [Dehalococcoidia bacterium]